MADNDKTRKTPSSVQKPAHTLLDAIRTALDAGVQPAKIVPVLDMARNASGVMQAPVWRSCANALDEYAKQVPGQPQT